MDDLISRQAVLNTAEWVCKACEGNFLYYHDLLVAAIMDMAPEQRWIPCSELMPKPKEYEDDVQKYYLIQNEFGDMMVCSWDGKCWAQMYQHKNIQDKVVAWMPLPEPAKIGDEQDE